MKLNEYTQAINRKYLKEDFWNPGPDFNNMCDIYNEVEDEWEEKTGTDWNHWDQATRDAMCDEVAQIYIDTYGTPSQELYDDMEDNNYHSQSRAFDRAVFDGTSVAESTKRNHRRKMNEGFTSDRLYDELCALLTDYETGEGSPVDIEDMYEMLVELQRPLKESLFGDYDDYDGWTEEDIELHKNIDWASRNYFDYPVDGDSFESTAVLYTPQGKKTTKTTFVKYIRSNPIFPPYYAPKDMKPFGTKIGYVGPMADGHVKNGYDIHDRYETQEVYDILSR